MNDEQLNQIRAKYNIPTGGYGKPSSSLFDESPVDIGELDSLWGTEVKKEVPIVTGVKEIASDLSKRGSNIVSEIKRGGESYQKSIEGKENPLMSGLKLFETGLRTVGQVAGGVGDIIAGGIKTVTPEPIKKQFVESWGKTFENDETASQLADKYAEFTQKYPEATKDFEAVLNIATLPLASKGSALAKQGLQDLKTGVSESFEAGLKKEAGQAFQKTFDQTVDIISPKLSKEAEMMALKRGSTGVSEGGVMTKGKIKPDNRTMSIAEASDGIVNPKNSPVQNIDALNSKVGEINEGVKQMVYENKAPFNTNQLRTKLSKAKEESRVIFGSDKTLESQYDAIIDEFIKQVKGKDTKGLLDARQTFDQVIEQKFPGLLSSPAGDVVRRNAILDTRRAANEYISELLPKNNPYKASLLTEHRLLQAVENIAEKNVGKVINQSDITALIKRHPSLRWLLLTMGGGLAGAGVTEFVR